MLWSHTRGNGPKIVLVHGFTQTHECWGAIADIIARDHEVVAVDAPGHGGSSSIEVGLVEGAAMIGMVGGRAIYLGYSMGGRFCLHLALNQPHLVAALILVGASPGIQDDDARRERATLDEQRARRLEVDGLDTFLNQWTAQPMFAGIPQESLCIEARRANTVAGLASSLRLAGTGAQEPLFSRLASLTMPVLLIVGENDLAFSEQAQLMASCIGENATVSAIEGAGHAPHLERPEEFMKTLTNWLSSIE